MRRRLLFAALVSIAAVIAGFMGSGCQVALRATDGDAKCDLPEGTLCPGSTYTCQGGVCRPCVPKDEVCNGIDDNCNGEIDEGFDKDGDGYKTCGNAGEIDCNDDPITGKDIHPGAPELCNGIDDNCNGRIDETPNDCPEDSECWSDKGRCTIKGDCRIHGCASGGCDPESGLCTQADCVQLGRCSDTSLVCDPKSRRCVKIVNFGESCDDSVLCATGFQCLDSSIVSLASRPGSFCTRSCCASEDCPAGAVCRLASNGAALCVKSVDLGLTLGTKAAFSACTKGTECRSGVCGSTLKCVDGCCGTLACGAGGTCAYASDKKFLCRAPASSTGKEYNGQCYSGVDCKSGACIAGGSSLSPGWCSQRCCSSKDCLDPIDRCEPFDAGNGNIINLCLTPDTTELSGGRIGGDTCAKDSDCRGVSCVDGRCNDTCCKDSDCAEGTVCRPKREAVGYPLRCVAPL